MKKFLTVCVLLVLTVLMTAATGGGCASLQTGGILHHVDKFDGYETWTMGNNKLPFDCYACNLDFGLVKFIKDNKTSYMIKITYLSSNWFFIDRGESLVLLVDGNRMGFTGDGSFAQRITMGTIIKEIASYDIKDEEIKKMAYAQTIEVKLKGQNGYQNTQFTEENISNINKFYHQYVLNQIPAADDNMTVYEEK